MIEPHGGSLVNRVIDGKHAEQVRDQVQSTSDVRLTPDQFQDLINLATGRFSPLKGFMTQNDLLKAVHDMTLEDGTVWPLPITLDTKDETAKKLSPGGKAGLRSPSGKLVGAVEIEGIYKQNKEEATEHIFGTSDPSHPGVDNYLGQHDFFVSGPIFLFGEHRHNDHDLSPAESRVLFQHQGWDTVVGFQTRNAPHRAHEYIQRSALEQVDGLFVQPKLGDKKVGDYRDDVILGAYEALVENYYRQNRVALSVFPSKMRYAGPREAVYDAIVRKNQGCTHFVIGRDHAGVSDYYGEFDAQRIFNEISGIGIEILRYDYSFYCARCDGMTSRKICPHDDNHREYPSGTKIRRKIRGGDAPSEKVMRPEVAKYIMSNSEPFVTETTGGE